MLRLYEFTFVVAHLCVQLCLESFILTPSNGRRDVLMQKENQMQPEEIHKWLSSEDFSTFVERAGSLLLLSEILTEFFYLLKLRRNSLCLAL